MQHAAKTIAIKRSRINDLVRNGVLRLVDSRLIVRSKEMPVWGFIGLTYVWDAITPGTSIILKLSTNFVGASLSLNPSIVVQTTVTVGV